MGHVVRTSQGIQAQNGAEVREVYRLAHCVSCDDQARNMATMVVGKNCLLPSPPIARCCTAFSWPLRTVIFTDNRTRAPQEIKDGKLFQSEALHGFKAHRHHQAPSRLIRSTATPAHQRLLNV